MPKLHGCMRALAHEKSTHRASPGPNELNCKGQKYFRPCTAVSGTAQAALNDSRSSQTYTCTKASICFSSLKEHPNLTCTVQCTNDEQPTPKRAMALDRHPQRREASSLGPHLSSSIRSKLPSSNIMSALLASS